LIVATSSTPPGSLSKRKLLLRDSLTFFILFVVAAILFGITLMLFRGFESQHEGLAVRWSERGRQQLKAGDAKSAVSSLRAALQYAPDDVGYQVLLAEALAAAGETDQAKTYFLNLKTARPGDGFLNLQLARLERREARPDEAIEDYHAAIFGDWQGDGVERRRAARLELVDYFIQRHDFTGARAELLIATGNAPNQLDLNLLLGDKFVAAEDPRDALQAYQRAIANDPANARALASAGRVAYGLGDYDAAHKLLRRALAAGPKDRAELEAMEHDAGRLVELSLSRELPAGERAQHLLAAWTIAQARLNACAAQLAPGTAGSAGAGSAEAPPALEDLKASWQKASKGATRRALVENAAAQDTMTQLIDDTEIETAQWCGQPTGDDALLLMLARAHVARGAAAANGVGQ